MIVDHMSDEELAALWRLRDALSRHRWPWQPLGERLGGSLRAQAAMLGVHDRQVSRWRRYGLTDAQADRLAIVAGRHPCEVWADWHHVGDTGEESRLEEAA